MSKYSEVFSSLQNEITQVEEIMRNQVSGHHPDLVAALDLLLSSGGKRVRPTITILIGNLFNADKQKILTMAAAIELLHTATLVHDDLIDESLLRRGVPTLNSKWSPGATILTGDFLFASAARIAAETGSIEVIKQFSNTLIVICNGEISQMFGNICQLNREDYFARIFAKTASLFEASACSAAIIGSKNEQCVEQFRHYGREVGMAFQMMDDILDFTGAQATFGKPIGNDLLHGLITLPTICFVEMYPDHSSSKKLTAGECLEEYEVLDLIENIRTGEAIKKAMDEARIRSTSAISVLEGTPANSSRDALISIAEFIVERAF